jgi:hypothetical protein
VSLLVNVLAVAGVIRSIDARGGWEYLRARWEGAPDRRGVNLDWANYVHRQTLFECLPKRTGRVVFAGDSLTQGCEWGELYPGVLNRRHWRRHQRRPFTAKRLACGIAVAGAVPDDWLE